MNIKWVEVSEERYDEMLGVLPPLAWERGGFLVGEAMDHDPSTGRARYSAFQQLDGKFYAAEQSLSVRDFRGMDRVTSIRDSLAREANA